VARDYHANDFVVFKGTPGLSNPSFERGVFMHELGHTLGLGHGGIDPNGDPDHTNNKPNYISVMNYLFDLPFNAGNTWRLDYSHGTMLPLIESSLDETAFLTDGSGYNNGVVTYRPGIDALCPAAPCDPITPTTVLALSYTIGSGPKDLNADGLLTTTGVCMDLNYYGTSSPTAEANTPSPCEIMNDHNDWAGLIYALVDESTDGAPTNPPIELTVAEIQAMQAFLPPAPCLADVDQSGVVDVNDLLAVITGWGTCAAPPSLCSADIAPLPVDGRVNVDDLLAVILNWGPCPRP